MRGYFGHQQQFVILVYLYTKQLLHAYRFIVNQLLKLCPSAYSTADEITTSPPTFNS